MQIKKKETNGERKEERKKEYVTREKENNQIYEAVLRVQPAGKLPDLSLKTVYLSLFLTKIG